MANPITATADTLITPTSRLTISSTTERCSASGRSADRAAVLQPAALEHRAGGDDAQLLGEERHDDRQPGVEVVEVVGRARGR